MRAVVQRVKSACVTIDGRVAGQIGPGLMVLLGVSVSDEASDSSFLAEKIVNLRIFEDDQGKMNRSLMDTGGRLLVVSQFTLYGDCRKGRRPSFIHAAQPEKAEPLYERFISRVREKGVPVQTGEFGAMMDVSLVNAGPVTLILESRS